MRFSLSVAAAAALLPALSSAHYLFPHVVINGRVTNAHEYNREHDNGFQPLGMDILNSPDFRCNKGSWNHRNQPKTLKVTAGVDTVGFKTGPSEVFHPDPITVSLGPLSSTSSPPIPLWHLGIWFFFPLGISHFNR
jgi:hypothetical protein